MSSSSSSSGSGKTTNRNVSSASATNNNSSSMSQQHHREDEHEDHAQREPFMFNVQSKKGQLTISAAELLALKPQPFHGTLMKRDRSWIAFFLPCLFPKWKQRYFVIAGNYLFRFTDEEAESPKGVPIPLDVCQIHEVADEPGVFEVNSIRKNYLLRAENVDEMRKWIRALKVRKVEAIRENMGHVEVSLYFCPSDRSCAHFSFLLRCRTLSTKPIVWALVLFDRRLTMDRAEAKKMNEGIENPLFKLQ
jgi:hypothetical protein